MKKLSFLTACLFTMLVSQAQRDSTPPIKQKPFDASVRTLDGRTIYGRVFTVNDSQLVLVRSSRGRYAIPSENIESFKLRRKNSVLKGALIGFGIGALTGVIAGLANGDDNMKGLNFFAMTAKRKAVVMGTGLGVAGGIVGATIGTIAKKKFTIGGKKEKFRDLQAEIMMTLIRK